jgi:CII-binding regulator of phage lambda lysogenization HflD
MLSLFIGAITMSMSESMEELKSSIEEKTKQEAMERNTAKMMAIAEKVKQNAELIQKLENQRLEKSKQFNFLFFYN